MRTLLIVPPFFRLLGGQNNWVNLGPAYLGAMLDSHGFEVKIYNTDYLDENKDLNLREVFEGNKIYREIMADENHPLWKEILDEIKAYNPDLVGISINFTMIAKASGKIAKLIKEWNPNVKIVVGGPHATIVPDETLSDENIDFLIRHEGEYALLELVQGKDHREIEGLGYKDDNGKLIHNPDRNMIENLDVLPFPKLELQLKDVKVPEENFGVIATSRGCPFQCIFCASPGIWKGGVRYRSIKNVMKELRWRYENYGVKKFYFNDDNFNLNKERTFDLCNAIMEEGLNIDWICEGQIRTITREILEVMKAAGCKRLKLGIESGNNRILKLMKKGTTKEQIREKIKLIKEVDIDLTIYIIIGMPSETKEEMMETYDFVEEIAPSYLSLSVASPQYGTTLFDMMQETNISFTKDDWLEHFHQSYKTILNDKVDDEIIDKFLSYNDKKGFARTI
jgi:anaerobic magnesium-protoporphyrin IX monomethyl ester cyclase